MEQTELDKLAERLKLVPYYGTSVLSWQDPSIPSRTFEVGKDWDQVISSQLLEGCFTMWAESDRQLTVKWLPIMIYKLLKTDHDFTSHNYERFCEVFILEVASLASLVVLEFGLDYQFILSRCCEQVYKKYRFEWDAREVVCAFESLSIVLQGRHG